MKAMVIEGFGGIDAFKEREMPKPDLMPGHVLIRVAATSVNPLDFKIRAGALEPITHPFPAILHGDVAGVVTDVGEGVSKFKVGDEVYGCAGGVASYQGALAEYMLVDADFLAHKPKKLTMREAASLPLVAITAWQALIDRAKLKPGQKVLIHAGAGGVGHIAIQLAKWRGATVFTTVSTEEKGSIARDLGADELIFYKRESVQEYLQRCTEGGGFDVVFDTLGGDTLDASMQAISHFGQVVSILGETSHDLRPLFMKNGTLHMVLMLAPLLSGYGRPAQGKIMEQVSELVDRGVVRPLLDKHDFTFTQAGKAHAYLESGKAVGKIVLSSPWHE